MDLDEFLSSAKPVRAKTCQTCRLPAVCKALVAFYAKKDAGETMISLRQLHGGYLVPTLNYPLSYAAVYQHARKCLGRAEA